jgi:hypothetical protein
MKYPYICDYDFSEERTILVKFASAFFYCSVQILVV